MNASQPAKEKVIVTTALEPAVGAATTNTAWIAAKDFCNYLALIMAGPGLTSLDAKIQQATDNTGTGAKDVTVDNAGVTTIEITQLVAAGTALLNFSQQDLDYNNSFDFVSIEIITVGASANGTAALLATDAIYSPADQGSIVDEVIG